MRRYAEPAVVPIGEAVSKISVAVESSDSCGYLIVARTNARTAHGLDEAGANILFIETRESEAERERIGTCLDAPLLANMLEGGTTVLSGERLVGLGCRVAIFPASGFLIAGAALRKVYEELRNKGSTEDFTGEIYSFTDSAV